MLFTQTKLPGLYSIKLEPIVDRRGFFVRMFCKNDFYPLRKNLIFTQVNHSLTKEKGSIRGMHFQYPPYCETRIVRCLSGAVFDVAVDLRINSKTYLQWHGELLSGKNMKMLYIPEGFAHGFQTLADDCAMLYFHTGFYNKKNEGGVRYDDPAIGIKWKMPVANISARDRNLRLIDNTFEGINL